MEDKPKVLVLGGVGFVGRNFVKYLVDNDLASYIRVVDKVLPPTAFLGKPHQAAFDDSRVEFMQGNLTNPSTFGLALSPCLLLEEDHYIGGVWSPIDLL